MSKAEHLNKAPRIVELIAEIYTENPYAKPKAIHKALLSKMKEKGLDKNHSLNWPGIDSVRNKLKEMREIEKSDRSLDMEDRPWSLVSLSHHDIYPDALPIVMKAWAKGVEYDKPLTIRQAKWIARIYCLFPTMDKYGNDLIIMIEAACGLAGYEKMSILSGREYPKDAENALMEWQNDAILYEILTKDNRMEKKIQNLSDLKYKQILAYKQLLSNKKEVRNEPTVND